MKPTRNKNAESNDQSRRGDRVVSEAVAERSGKTASRYPVHLARQNDQLSLLRYVKLVDARGRSVTRTLEANLHELGYVNEKQRTHARRAALALQTWCSKRGLPQFMEVMHRRNARAFLRDLAARGRAQRTIENYRTVLSRLADSPGRQRRRARRSLRRA
jgi:hypothetical protein